MEIPIRIDIVLRAVDDVAIAIQILRIVGRLDERIG
jgi:hypothetical protein